MDEYFKVQNKKAMVQIRMEHNKGANGREYDLYLGIS